MSLGEIIFKQPNISIFRSLYINNNYIILSLKHESDSFQNKSCNLNILPTKRKMLIN